MVAVASIVALCPPLKLRLQARPVVSWPGHRGEACWRAAQWPPRRAAGLLAGRCRDNAIDHCPHDAQKRLWGMTSEIEPERIGARPGASMTGIPATSLPGNLGLAAAEQDCMFPACACHFNPHGGPAGTERIGPEAWSRQVTRQGTHREGRRRGHAESLASSQKVRAVLSVVLSTGFLPSFNELLYIRRD